MKTRNTILAISALFIPVSMFAQYDGTSLLNNVLAQLKSLINPIYDVIVYVMILLAMVSLVMIVVKMGNSENNGVKSAVGWFGLLLFSIVAAAVLKSLA